MLADGPLGAGALGASFVSGGPVTVLVLPVGLWQIVALPTGLRGPYNDQQRVLTPPVPRWSTIYVGDIDLRWLDISDWSTARGGDLPIGPIAVAVNPANGLVALETYLATNVPVVGGSVMADAISCQLDAIAADPGVYLITLSFTTETGAIINRDVKIEVHST
jgi:hypothetical protein